MARELSATSPDQPIAFYADAGKFLLLMAGGVTNVERAQTKRLVANRKVRLVVATDAACEGSTFRPSAP